MGRKGFEKVSQREYARRLNISNEAVSRAVREGRIRKGWNAKEGKIIVEYADKEFGLLHRNTNVTELIQDPGEDTPPQQSQGPATMQLTASSSYGDARRVKEIMSAQLIALDLKERKGELVNKDQVFKQLYAFGQEMRTAFTSLPDRIIDDLLASKSRADAHNLLTNGIYEVMEKLIAGASKLDFQPNDKK